MLTRYGIVAALLACTGLAAANWVSVPRVMRLEAAPATEPVVAPAAVETPDAPGSTDMGLDCVRGFSKDYCNGIMYPGHSTISGCNLPVQSCRTLRIDDAVLVISVFGNDQVCGSSRAETCDEFRNGRLKVNSDFTIRLQKHCPFRGCWDGTYAEFTTDDGTVYAGMLLGTIGVGTHRPSTAPSICAVSPGTRDCERCYDVSSTADGYRIGYEAAFKGVAATGEELCFSLSGDFYIRNGIAGPLWDSEWAVAGTADGVHITFCP